jgi:hypothetical protein
MKSLLLSELLKRFLNTTYKLWLRINMNLQALKPWQWAVIAVVVILLLVLLAQYMGWLTLF